MLDKTMVFETAFEILENSRNNSTDWRRKK
jgi:hypothetical protein